jgi:peptidoglycan/LPS O-acetylase OafA/YrhL
VKFAYRPEIDGLRAIAVTAVILYHARIIIFGDQFFKGGFIGVDIFFVISGYLITSIILKELITTNSFSFKYFYQRRVRRILPVLLFVMVVTLPFAWSFLLPSAFIDFSKSILYSLGFSSNFYFWYSGQEYGAESGLLKPFLHTWSLSVEEQYYIIFPIIFFITFKYFKKYLIHILIIGFIVSLGLADWASKNYYASLNFYILPTRAWELLAGSILSYFEFTKSQTKKNGILNLILPSVGMLLIGHSIIFFNDKMFHPSFYTLSPVIGVCLIIWFSNKDELITKILTTKLFVKIGLISYSLYLWHYPLFAFYRIIKVYGITFSKIYLILILFILSFFSYYFIEKKFRSINFKFKNTIIYIIVTLLFLTFTNFWVVKNQGLKERLPVSLSDIDIDPQYHLLRDSKDTICLNKLDGCSFNTSSNKKVYLIGDSIMGSISNDLKNKIVTKNYQFNTFTMGDCLFFPGFNRIDDLRTDSISKKCNDDYFQKIQETISKDDNSIIIIGGMIRKYITLKNFDSKEGCVVHGGEPWNHKYESIYKTHNIKDDIKDSFVREVSKFSQNNKVILIYPLPEICRDPVTQIKKKWLLRSDVFGWKNKISDIVSVSSKVFNDSTLSSFGLLNSIRGKNIYRVYPHQLFCDKIKKDRCVANNDRHLFYSDSEHPSFKGVEMINELIMKEIKNIELEIN